MSQPAWRKKLEGIRRNGSPIGRAADGLLRYAEDLELIVQEFIDRDRDYVGTRGLETRALRLLDRGGRRHGDGESGGGDPGATGDR